MHKLEPEGVQQAVCARLSFLHSANQLDRPPEGILPLVPTIVPLATRLAALPELGLLSRKNEEDVSVEVPGKG